MNNKVIYFRGEELITQSDKDRILKLWGDNRGYNFFTEHEYNSGYGTGLDIVVNILSTVQNNQRLNERDIALSERIAKNKKLTKASGRGYDYVEQNLLSDLLKDALLIFNKENDNADSRISPNMLTHVMYEFFRIYKLPYPSVMRKIEAEELKLIDIPEPKKRYEITPAFSKLEPEYSQNSSYKEYNVKLDGISSSIAGNKAFSNTLYKKYPFLGKLYFSTIYSDKYWQIYVHDYFDRDWALQTIVHEMYSK